MPKITWRPFPEARAFVRTLGLLDQNEWYAYARGDLLKLLGERPGDIPSCPAREYRGEGWRGIRDWLGPAPVDPVEPGYLDFKRAFAYVRALELSGVHAWNDWCDGRLSDKPQRPQNIPLDPASMYPRAWRGWPHWIGSEVRVRSHSRHRPFDEAREFARGLGLANVKQWRALCKGETPHGGRPRDVPANPDNVYRFQGWLGYGDWLGTDAVAASRTAHLPYAQLRHLVQELGLASGEEYLAWASGNRPDLGHPPPAVPTCPWRTYADLGWTSWGEFLGTGSVAPGAREYPPFESARAFAHELGLRNHYEWADYVRGDRPDLPSAPCDLPANPDSAYRDLGWTNWGDFLGTGFVASMLREYRPFEEARAFVCELGLVNNGEWRAYCVAGFIGKPELPADIPAAPERVYAESGWSGWGDFMGSGNLDPAYHRWLSFEEARTFARALGLRSRLHWEAWCRPANGSPSPRPADVPANPQTKYARYGWKGWADFLGRTKRR